MILKLLTFVRDNPLLTIASLGIAAFAIVHVVWYIHPSDIDSTESLTARLHDGQPTVVEWYSNL